MMRGTLTLEVFTNDVIMEKQCHSLTSLCHTGCPEGIFFAIPGATLWAE